MRHPFTLSSTHFQEAGRSVGSSPTQPAETRYFGQRPWRIGIIGNHSNKLLSTNVVHPLDHEPSSPEHEMECIQLLQAHEYLMKHSVSVSYTSYGNNAHILFINFSSYPK